MTNKLTKDENLFIELMVRFYMVSKDYSNIKDENEEQKYLKFHVWVKEHEKDLLDIFNEIIEIKNLPNNNFAKKEIIK